MKKLSTLARRSHRSALLAVAIFTAPTLWSASWFDIDFESEQNVVGQTPYTQSAIAAPHINTNPTSINSGVNSVRIVENFSAGSATLSGKSAVISYDPVNENAPQLVLTNAAGDYIPAQPWRIDFDFLFDSSAIGATANTLGVRVRNTDANSGLVVHIIFQHNGSLQLASGTKDGSTNSLTFNEAWSFDTVESFTGILNPESREFSAYIGDSLIGNIGIGDEFVGDAFGVQSVVFRSTSTTAGATFTVGIDNIVTSIPEPGQVAALAGVLVLMLAIGHRRWSRK